MIDVFRRFPSPPLSAAFIITPPGRPRSHQLVPLPPASASLPCLLPCLAVHCLAVPARRARRLLDRVIWPGDIDRTFIIRFGKVNDADEGSGRPALISSIVLIE